MDTNGREMETRQTDEEKRRGQRKREGIELTGFVSVRSGFDRSRSEKESNKREML